MTQAQIRWAANHDWFVASVFSGTEQGALVEDRAYHPDRQLNTVEHRIFTDFRKLRAWAGY